MPTLLQQRHQPITAPKLRDRVPAQRATPRASARHEPAAAVPNRPVEAPRGRWRLILGSIVATLREWRRRSVDRSQLARLDERTLRDIGLDPRRRRLRDVPVVLAATSRLARLIAVASNRTAVTVAAATGQGRRIFACGNQSAAKPVMCFQVVSLLLAATLPRPPCQ